MPSVPSASAESFRRVMARWATGVAVVTARDGIADGGLTVNAFLSVSLDPPTVLVSLMHDVDTLPILERSGWFGASFLAADQRDLSTRFARADPPATKFRDLPVHRGPHGSALLDHTLGAIECRVVSQTLAYDHVLVLGEVVYQEVGRDALPLVFYRSAYGDAEPPERLRLSPRPPLNSG